MEEEIKSIKEDYKSMMEKMEKETTGEVEKMKKRMEEEKEEQAKKNKDNVDILAQNLTEKIDGIKAQREKVGDDLTMEQIVQIMQDGSQRDENANGNEGHGKQD